jgi:hypothetical protein
VSSGVRSKDRRTTAPAPCEVLRVGGVIPRWPHAGRRCLARSMRCGGRHERCPWCRHVPDVLDDRCDVLSRLWTVGRTGARQYLDRRLVQLPALRPRVVRAHSERTTRRFGSRRGLRAERGEQSAALTRVMLPLSQEGLAGVSMFRHPAIAVTIAAPRSSPRTRAIYLQDCSATIFSTSMLVMMPTGSLPCVTTNR